MSIFDQLEANDRRRASLVQAARGKLKDPDDILAFVHVDELPLNDDGQPSEYAAKAAVRDVQEQYGLKFRTAAEAGTKLHRHIGRIHPTKTPPPKLSRDALARMVVQNPNQHKAEDVQAAKDYLASKPYTDD